MGVPNPSLPVPKNPQVFVVPVRVKVDSDDGKVTLVQVQQFLEEPLADVLTDQIFDRFDRLSGMPAEFAFHEAAPEWPAAFEAVPTELDERIEKVLQEKEAAVLDQDFDRAAELRKVGHELIQQRGRIAALGLPPILCRALARALNYARANADDINEAHCLDSIEVTSEHYEMLQKRFGLDT